MTIHRIARLAVVATALAVVSPAVASAKANETDLAFVREMIPHHQMATEMAKMDGRPSFAGEEDRQGAGRRDPHDEQVARGVVRRALPRRRRPDVLTFAPCLARDDLAGRALCRPPLCSDDS
jgi:hypothetical protein